MRLPDGNRIRFQMAVGKAIASHRQRCGITQAQLAKTIGMSQSSVNKMEEGVVPPTSWAVYQLALAFDCQTDEILVDPESAVAA